jgi:uncharacterized protein YciI
MHTFVYLLSPTRPEMVTEPTAEEAEAVGAHARRLAAEAARGAVIVAGRTADRGADTVGIVVFRAPDAAAARAFVDADPAVVAGVMTARLEPMSLPFGSPVALEQVLSPREW